MKNNIYTLLGITLLSVVMGCASHQPKPMKTITIDVGHSGKNIGAKVGDITEKMVLHRIADKINVLSQKDNNQDIKLHFLKSSDKYISLGKRAEIINRIKPDLSLSLHIDFVSNSSRSGINVYFSEKNILAKQSEQFAHKMLNCLAVKEMKKGNVYSKNFTIIRKAQVPSIHLAMGFLSNPTDRAYLTSEQGQNKLAEKIYRCLKVI